MEITISDKLKEAWSNVQLVALIIRNVQNKDYDDEKLEKEKKAAEQYIRETFKYKKKVEQIVRVMQYDAFYSQFNEIFPVERKIVDIINGKEMLSENCLIEIMRINEIVSYCIMSGHDLDAIEENLVLDLASGKEIYIKINGEAEKIKQDDIILKDKRGVIFSLLDGPDNRTKLIRTSKNIIYFVYFPFFISRPALVGIMANFKNYLKIVEGPHAQIERYKIYPVPPKRPLTPGELKKGPQNKFL